VNTFVCRQFPVEMASEELKIFLSSVSSAYLKFADAIHEGGITSKAELGAVERTDLQALGIPLGAAALITATARGSGDSFGTLLFSCVNIMIFVCHNLLPKQNLLHSQLKKQMWSVSGQKLTDKSCKPYQLHTNLAQCGQPSRLHKATRVMKWSLISTDHC